MALNRWGCFVAGAAAALVIGHSAWAQMSRPGPSGPVIHDRMIFFEAALMHFDQRLGTVEATLKNREAQIAKLEKDVQSARERIEKLEAKVAGLESVIRRVAAGVERGPAGPPNASYGAFRK